MSGDSSIESDEESVEEEEESEEKVVARRAQSKLDDDHCGKFFCVYYTRSRYWGRLQKVSFLLFTFLFQTHIFLQENSVT